MYIDSSCLQNFRHYNLGTDKFLNSVTKITLDYSDAEDKPDVDKDIELMRGYFKNLHSVNLNNLKYLSISEVVKIYQDNESDKILSTESHCKNKSEFVISSNIGYVLLFDCMNEYLIKFKDFSLESRSENTPLKVNMSFLTMNTQT